MVLLTYYHISSFSFINIWYIGFIPIILVSLHPQKIGSEWKQILYAAFAVSVCLSKPSLILIPLIVYRVIRHKEYLLGSILTFAIALQTLLFFTSSYYHANSVSEHVGIFAKLGNIVLYPGVVLLKLFEAYSASLGVVIIGSVFVALLVLLSFKARGIIQAGLLITTLTLSVYTAIYSPDSYPVSVRRSFETLLYDEMKLQREVMISFFILLLGFIAINFFYERYKNRIFRRPSILLSVIVAVLLVLTAIEYRPIDTKSSKLYINLDPFRGSLSLNAPICMPIPPTPSWVPYNANKGPTYGWYYENGAYGSCIKRNYEKTIDFNSFNQSIGRGANFELSGDDTGRLTSILLAVVNPTPRREHVVTLENSKTGKSYSASIVAKKNGDTLSFLAFDLSKEPLEKSYHYIIKERDSSDSTLTVGKFEEGGMVLFPYFLVR